MTNGAMLHRKITRAVNRPASEKVQDTHPLQVSVISKSEKATRIQLCSAATNIKD